MYLSAQKECLSVTMLNYILNIDFQINKTSRLKIWQLSFLILFIIAPLFGIKTQAQTNSETISVNAKDTSVADVFENINKQYNIKIAFNSSDLKKIRISEYQAENQHIDKIISDLLKNTEFSFKHIGNQIVIIKNESKDDEKNNKRELPSKEERLRLIVRDTIYQTDTIFVTKIETVHKTDTVKIIIPRVDTVFVDKNHDHNKTHSSLFIKNIDHNEQFSLGLSYSQQISFLNFKSKNEINNTYINDLKESINHIAFSNPSLRIEGAYRKSKWDISFGISYNSYKNMFSFVRTEYEDPYYLLDTIDTYYHIDNQTLDTTFYHIIDSTFMPGTEYNYSAHNKNHLSYLGIDIGLAYTFYDTKYLSLFVKTYVHLDFLIKANGMYITDNKDDRIQSFTKGDFKKVKFTGTISVGTKIGVTESLDLVPEIYYKHYFGSITHHEYIKTSLNLIGLKLGINYYF